MLLTRTLVCVNDPVMTPGAYHGCSSTFPPSVPLVASTGYPRIQRRRGWTRPVVMLYWKPDCAGETRVVKGVKSVEMNFTDFVKPVVSRSATLHTHTQKCRIS